MNFWKHEGIFSELYLTILFFYFSLDLPAVGSEWYLNSEKLINISIFDIKKIDCFSTTPWHFFKHLNVFIESRVDTWLKQKCF